MTVKALASRLEELFINGTWIANTNYNEILEDVTWQESERKIGNHNSIASVTFHINYYLEGVSEVFLNRPLTIRDKFSFDCQKITSEDEWKTRKTALVSNAKTLIGLVKQLPEDKLQHGFVKPEYGTYLRNINGLMEHSYYHLGQISLIKKLIRESSNL
ncbi:DUF1572 domain-containing protein [Winogradskyella maritima]|uniref:DUF1572 domain-containing protein n=1 Tax=Winogradskyella maritima TaxID=1517766 RepID=A0ABV8AL19_9FLAO|nr:DUF1572 domain-containing protein [Winogradskyella maritima]